VCKTVTEVQGFLGTLGTIHIFIKNFAAIAQPLVNLTKKGVEFEFGKQKEAMKKLKTLTEHYPAICALDYTSNNEVVLAVDTSHIAVDYILQQLGNDHKCYPSQFGSITLNKHKS
jgi:hypothetical protein